MRNGLIEGKSSSHPQYREKSAWFPLAFENLIIVFKEFLVKSLENTESKLILEKKKKVKTIVKHNLPVIFLTNSAIYEDKPEWSLDCTAFMLLRGMNTWCFAPRGTGSLWSQWERHSVFF